MRQMDARAARPRAYAATVADRIPLPAEFTSGSFGIAEALARGVSARRLRNSDLAQPYWGVRGVTSPDGLAERARAFGPRLLAHQAISGFAAAACWGLPLPSSIADPEVEVVAPWGHHPPRAKGIRGRRILAERWRAIDLDGLRVIPPALTVAMLARHCTLEQLVAIGDAAITAAPNYPRLRDRPLCTMAELRETLETFGRGDGVHVLRDALPLLRVGVESPMESVLRFVLVSAGLPEPLVNPEIALASGRRRGDLVYWEARLIVEYDGDHHWQSRVQFEADLARVRALEDAGWRVIRVTASDLGQARRRDLIDRVAAALETATAA